MQVEYRNGDVLRLENLTDEEVVKATHEHILDQIERVERAEIFRMFNEADQHMNRHERRKQAALERREK